MELVDLTEASITPWHCPKTGLVVILWHSPPLIEGLCYLVGQEARKGTTLGKERLVSPFLVP